MSEHGSVARRRFMAGAATAAAGLSFGTTRSLHGQCRKGTFGTLKQVVVFAAPLVVLQNQPIP